MTLLGLNEHDFFMLYGATILALLQLAAYIAYRTFRSSSRNPSHNARTAK